MTKELLQEIVTKNIMYVEWKTTPITHINYETVKQRFNPIWSGLFDVPYGPGGGGTYAPL